MLRKTYVKIAISFLLTFIFMTRFILPLSANQTTTHTLLIYDSLSLGSSYEGNINDLKRLLSSFNLDFTVITTNQYEANSISSYKNVIVLQNKDELTDFNYLLEEDLKRFKGKYLHIGYNPPKKLQEQVNFTISTKIDHLIHFSGEGFREQKMGLNSINLIEKLDDKSKGYGSLTISSSSNVYPLGILKQDWAYLAFYLNESSTSLYSSHIIQNWLEIDLPGKLYIMLSEIYPYSDLEKLKEIADELYNLGIPFIVSANPIFSNLDYPASQLYVDTLKYIQSLNGSIIVDAPNVSNILSSDRTIIHQKMELFLNWIIDNGIVPLGASAQLHWFFDNYYLDEALTFYESVIIFPDNSIIHYEPTNLTPAFNSSLYLVEFTDWSRYIVEDYPLLSMPTNIAININYVNHFTDIDNIIKQLTFNWINISDYQTIDHNTNTLHNKVSSSNGILIINDSIVAKITNKIEFEKDYEYVIKEKAALSDEFELQNNVLIVVIIVVLFAFTFFLFNGYKVYKKKYTNRGM